MAASSAARAPAEFSTAVRPLEGPEKVAALLLSMGKPAATQLLKHFDDAELKLVSRAAAELGQVSVVEMETLIEEFARNFSVGADLKGTAREVEKLLTGILPAEQIADIMSEVMGKPGVSVWETVATLPEQAMAGYIANEHPQIGAFVLSKVELAQAARVMGELPARLRNQMLRRMLGVRPVQDPALRILEAAIAEDLLPRGQASGAKVHARLADIINKMDREQMEDMLKSLEEKSPEEAEALRALIFSFEDIVKLTQKARLTLFDKVPSDRVVMALKGAEPELRDVILSSLASRARRMVEAELNGDDFAPPREVSDARRAIADIALDLASRGEIDLRAPQEEKADA